MFFEESLKEKLKFHYTLENCVMVGDMSFDFLAHYYQRNSKFIVEKSYEYYAFETNDYIIFKKLEKPFSFDTLKMVRCIFKEHSQALLSLHDEHMESGVTLVFETALPQDKELIRQIIGFRYYKSFMLGLKGWMNGGLMLIDPINKVGLSNKYSKNNLKRLLP